MPQMLATRNLRKSGLASPAGGGFNSFEFHFYFMVRIDIDYSGDLHCIAQHGPSGRKLETDAPVDNRGRGESFSPTDLVATALGSCMATVMGIYAQDHGIDLRGMRITVGKEMTQTGPRRIARLTTDIYFPAGLTSHPVLERVAHTCPVHQSLHPEVEKPITFHYDR
jgi:putative redox protein